MTPADRMFAIAGRLRALLVVDNCEHLIGGVADLVAEILQRCPAVRVLATSREPLGIAGRGAVRDPAARPAAGGRHAPAQAAGYPGRPAAARPRAGGQRRTSRSTADTVGYVVRDRPPAGRPAAGHRAGRGPAAGAAGVARSPRGSTTGSGCSPAACAPRCPAPHPARGRRVELGPARRRAERLLAERLAVFPAGATSRGGRRCCGDGSLDRRDVPDLLLALVDKSLSWPASIRRPSRRRGTGCWRRSGSTASSGWTSGTNSARPGRRTPPTSPAWPASSIPVLRTADSNSTRSPCFNAERDNMLAALRYLGDSGYSAPPRSRWCCDLGWFWNITGNHADMTGLGRVRAGSAPLAWTPRPGCWSRRPDLLAAVSTGSDRSEEAWNDITRPDRHGRRPTGRGRRRHRPDDRWWSG